MTITTTTIEHIGAEPFTFFVNIIAVAQQLVFKYSYLGFQLLLGGNPVVRARIVPTVHLNDSCVDKTQK
jgi:hypothetical protein